MYSWAKEISRIDTQVSSEGVKARTKGFQYAFAIMIGSRCVLLHGIVQDDTAACTLFDNSQGRQGFSSCQIYA